MLSRWAAIACLTLLMLHSGGRAASAQASAEPACPVVYAIDHGRHVGIVVSARDFGAAAYFREKQLKDWRWLEFGWGDAAFYQTPDAGLALGLRAIFTSTEAVMHVVGFNNPPARAFPTRETRVLRLSEAGYRTMLDFIKRSFAHGAAGRVVLSKDAGDGRNYYYKALGRYHVFRTCNTWLAEALAAGGLPLDPQMVVRAGDLMSQLRALRWEGCKASRKAPETEEEEEREE